MQGAARLEAHRRDAGSTGADDGIRTRDPHLGKVVLYQLSHVRVRRTESRGCRAPLQPAGLRGVALL